MRSSFKRLKKVIRQIRAYWNDFASTKRGKRTLTITRYIVTTTVVAYLAYRLTTIGWGQVWGALPRTPWFYVIFLTMYLILPAIQAFIFSLIFGLSPLRLFPATLKKRIYNKDVLTYSGEVYLYTWVRDHVDILRRDIIHGIKDNAIISSLTSTLVASGLLATFFFTGLVVLPEFITQHEVTYVVGGIVVTGILLGVGISFRKSIFQISGHLIVTLFGLHLFRLIAVQGLQVAQWEVVAPSIAMKVWFTFLTLQIIVNRIPLVPSRDLFAVAGAIEVASAIQVPAALIVGLMLVHSVLDKLLNLLLFATMSIWGEKTIESKIAHSAPSHADSTSSAELPADDTAPLQSQTK